jgi:hypothetical protein
MGAETSQSIIVDFEKETKNRTIEPWKDLEDSRFYEFTINKENHGTVDISKALPYMEEIFMSFSYPLDILEVGSGNGFNTNLVSQLKNIGTLTATDRLDYKKKYYDVQTLLSHDAVKAHCDIDLLLLISPPPEGFMDYYAIKEYELKPQQKAKYLMILGELGASDGTDGIYHYLINSEHTSWLLLQKHPFIENIDVFGGECIKSVYFFKLLR